MRDGVEEKEGGKRDMAQQCELANNQVGIIHCLYFQGKSCRL